MTKTLVIHPIDRTTDFLDEIYKEKENTVVVRSNISGDELKQLICNIDPKELYMLGHGLPQGLLGFYRLVIDETYVNLLKGRDLVGLWCNADVFFKKHDLKGLYTGMWVSEPYEAKVFNLRATPSEITASNERFAKAVAEVLALRDRRVIAETSVAETIKRRYLTIHGLAQKHLKEDSLLAFNSERIYYNPRAELLLPPSTLDVEVDHVS